MDPDTKSILFSDPRLSAKIRGYKEFAVSG